MAGLAKISSHRRQGLIHVVNIIAGDDLATQGARLSAAMIMT